MRKEILILTITVILFATSSQALVAAPALDPNNPEIITKANIGCVQGVVINADDIFTYVSTSANDLSGWVLERNDRLSIGDKVVIVYDNAGTYRIDDDSFITLTVIY